MKIVMVAAENGALPHGKVGGIGDVIRDIPPALAAAGHQVDVIMPGYQRFSVLPGACLVDTLSVNFSGQQEQVDLYQLTVDGQADRVSLWVLEHPLFAIGGRGVIYCNDPPDRPYASDASKFALFSVAVAQAIISHHFAQIDVIHLHDWHTAMVAVLRAFCPAYHALQSIQTVFTIHNVAFQGVRPLEGDDSSLRCWFPALEYDPIVLTDPDASHCINLMRAAINLSDKVHAVSPSYAREILLQTVAEQGIYGADGLQEDLQRAASEGRLHGILNGCEYSELESTKTSSWVDDRFSPYDFEHLLSVCDEELLQWVASTAVVSSTHIIASRRLMQASSRWQGSRPAIIITSVGRITEQKIALLQQLLPAGETALEGLLDSLAGHGLFIMLGSGNAKLEQWLSSVSAQYEHFIFLRGYSDSLADSLYHSGDLFLMPSSFEPCGISQMLAMRAGQPCLVHAVGGLKDTVIHGDTGFTFNGETLQQQAENMLVCFVHALAIKRNDPIQWQQVATAAAKARFCWNDVAVQYVQQLYCS